MAMGTDLGTGRLRPLSEVQVAAQQLFRPADHLPTNETAY